MAPKLTFWEKLGFIPAVFSAILTAFGAIFTGVVRGPRGARSLVLHIKYAVTRKLVSDVSIRHLQAVSPSTNQVYNSFIKDASKRQSVDLGDGALGHWIGSPDAKNVLIWYHGGGFVLPANIGHFHFLRGVIDHASKAGKDLSVFVLTYSLAPDATYPTQIRQGVKCLRYVLEETNHQPGQVFIGGDSAGGNLAFAVLSHLSNPHPAVEKLTLQNKLGGLVGLGAWVTFDAKPARDMSDAGDIVSTRVSGPWSSAYLGGAPRDNYTDIAAAPAEWYRSFLVHEILLTAGGNELLVHSIRNFLPKLKDAFGNVELFVGDRECHVAPIAHLSMGEWAETDQGKKIKTWLTELL